MLKLFKKKELYRHDNSKEYLDVVIEAENKYRDNPIAKLEYVKKTGTAQDYLMALATTAQQVTSLAMIGDYSTTEPDIGKYDCLYRGIMDAVSHMDRDLPEGVFLYIINNVEGFTLDVIRRAQTILDKRQADRERTCY